MAGMQSCLAVVRTTIRLANKNGAFFQSTRGRHFLVYQMCSKRTHFNRNSLLIKSDLSHLFRLASTNITSNATENTAPPTPTPPTKAAESTVNTSTPVTPEATPAPVVIDESTLPPAPSVEDVVGTLEFVSTGLKEPSFESLGLGGLWPTGLIQQALEFMHINLDMPWWAAIATMTIVFRIAIFPLTLQSKKNAINMNNHLPQLQIINMKMTEARQTGNYYDAARYVQELQVFMKEKNIGTLRSFLPTLVQAPIFISVVYALSSMVKVPVESLKTGGLFWFVDLTIPDPYYVLPLVAATTMWVVLELGADGLKVDGLGSPFVKIFIRLIPFASLPISINLSQAVLWYWTVSNFFTLGQAALFKIPAVNNFLGMPAMIKHDPASLPMKKKGTIEGFKEGMANMKITKELEDRERLNTITFENAGKGPVPRTFKTNPKLKQKAAVKASGK